MNAFPLENKNHVRAKTQKKKKKERKEKKTKTTLFYGQGLKTRKKDLTVESKIPLPASSLFSAKETPSPF